MLNVYIRGLRDLQGRFASMLDSGLREIQLVEAEETAHVLQEIYRTRAPKSRSAQRGRGTFSKGINAHAESRGFGFAIQLTTDNPDLRKWLKEGTGIFGPRGQRIYPTHGRALGPITGWVGGGGSGPFYFHSIKGMKAQPWERDAEEEAAPAVVAMGNRIGNHVVTRLGTGAA